MRKTVLLCALLSMLAFGQNARAVFYTESLIYTGPPEYEEVYQYSEAGPTYVNASAYGKDAEANAEWWSTGGRFSKTWDNADQGWIYVFSDIEKVFEVTAAGPATISFAWNGSLEVIGNSVYDGDYNIYASGGLDDFTLGANADVYWYYDMESPGTLPVSETTTFTYDFAPGDVGHLFSVDLVFDTMVSLNGGSISMGAGETLEFASNFYDSLQITNITGGIQTHDNGPDVPEPSTALLLCAAATAATGIRTRKRW